MRRWLPLVVVAWGLALPASGGASSSAGLPGQEKSRMLMIELEGNRYLRREFDADGAVLDQQRILVGRVREEEDRLILPLSLEKLDTDGELRERSRIRLRCDPGAARMSMSLLLFSGTDGDLDAELQSEGEFMTFPVAPPDGARLPDLRIQVGLEKGALSFLGGRARIDLLDRRVSSEAPGSGYLVASRVEVRTYVLFIRVGSARYRSQEWVDPERGLVRHLLQAEDGSYSILERADEPRGGDP